MKIEKEKMLVINGMVYTLVTIEEVCTNKPVKYVCEICELRNICDNFVGHLCDIQNAQPNQFYIFIDIIEVVSLQIVNEILDSY